MKPKLVKKTQGILDEIQKTRTGPMIRNKQSREAVAKAIEPVSYPSERKNTGGIRGKIHQRERGTGKRGGFVDKGESTETNYICKYQNHKNKKECKIFLR